MATGTRGAPGKHSLHRMGFSRSDRSVERGHLQNHKHLFCICLYAADMWCKVAGLYGLSRVKYDTMRPRPVPQRKAPAFDDLVTEVVYQLWCARNRARYKKSKTILRRLGVPDQKRALCNAQRKYEIPQPNGISPAVEFSLAEGDYSS